MKAYYDLRAPEYDDWYEGSGLFAARDRPEWVPEREGLRAVLRALPPSRTLDVACGTGYLTRDLGGFLVALDQSGRMLAAAAPRLPHAHRVQGDGLALPFVGGAFDRLVTGHFYGHLLEAPRVAFLQEARRVAGELVVVDAAVREGVPLEQWQERVLEDGSRWQVYKRFFTPDALFAEIGPGRVLHQGRWFVVTAHPFGARAS